MLTKFDYPGILDLERNSSEDVARPAFFEDLNLIQIIDKISYEWGEQLETYFYFPANEASEEYRRRVYRDIKGLGLYPAFMSFVERMNNAERAAQNRVDCVQPLQKAAWNICCAVEYTEGVCDLKNALSGVRADMCSEGVGKLSDLLTEYTSTEEFSNLMVEARQMLYRMSSYRVRMTYENNRVVVESFESDGAQADYEQFLRFFNTEKIKDFINPFDHTIEHAMLERSVLSRFVKNEPEFFTEVEKFEKQYPEYILPELSKVKNEVQFYLSFCKFQMKLEEKGLDFCFPTSDASKQVNAVGLYDLALACANMERTFSDDGDYVVPNDFYLAENENFFVLTGPNQGGKTTFARSLGQLVYFTKMGLAAPAQSANIHYYYDLLTHFSVEESVETGRGKLKEELIRLSPMMEEKYINSFVIINELFTTAASYDACIMGKNVLKHFIKQKCHGIYVTHLHELCSADESVTGICAMLDAEGRQNYKVSRENIEYADCAKNQVNKHRLGYEQLRERLAVRIH